MSEGKCEKAAVKNGGKGKKTVAVMAAVALLLALAVGGTVAYIAATDSSIANQFLPAKVACEVVTDADGISVKNTDTLQAIPVYIRAAVVVNWLDSEGNVYGIAPQEGAGQDYTLTLNLQAPDAQTIDPQKWTQVGDFYYYNSVVEVGASTEPLVESYSVVEGKQPDGYTLSVEVVAEAIQAEGGDGNASAAMLAWGVQPDALN